MEENTEDRPGPGGKRTAAALAAVLTVMCLILVYFYWRGIIPGGDDGDADVVDLPDWYVPPSGSAETPDWMLDMTLVSDLQEDGYNGSGIVVGIVDTGIDDSHPEFADDAILLWKDFVNSRPEPYDDGGHGTAMASIIVASGSLRGIAQGVRLIIAKAIPGEGGGNDATVGAAISWCADPNGDGDISDGADIISLSLGGGEHPRFGSEAGTAARQAIDRGIIVVASAGNDGELDDGDVESPASEELVIAVGAIDSTGTIASFSSVGDNDGRTPQTWDDRLDPNKKPEVVAPGVGITAAFPDGRYASVSGTSPAAAFVSGTLALILQANPGYMRTGNSSAVIALKTAMMQTAEPMDSQDTPHDSHYGYGLIQAFRISFP